MRKFKRKTLETEVEVVLDSDKTEIKTDIPFLNHMLLTFSKYLGRNLIVRAKGDLRHHVIEDVALCLGRTLSEIDKKGIERFGFAIIPMDDAVTICGLDFSGRGHLIFDGEIKDGEISFSEFVHFFDTLCRNAGINAYIKVSGLDPHHVMESAFKAFAISLKTAIKKTSNEYRSAKGVLD